VVEDGAIAGTIVATITDAQVGDVGPTGGKLFAVAPNSEAAPSDLTASGWDDAVTAAAASTLGGKDNWVLPTRAQLVAFRTMFGSTEALRAALGLSEIPYWTSEESGTDAYAIDMVTGAESLTAKIRSLFEATVTMPHTMGRWAMAHVNGKLYFPQYNGTSLEIYDIAGGTFTTVTMPHSIYRDDMAHVDGKLYFPQHGGTSLEIYTIANGTFTTVTMPHSMSRVTMAHVNGKLYFPEYDGTSLEIYDIASGTFTTVTMPHTMRRWAMAHVDGKLYFPQSNGTSLEIYDIASGTFTTVTMPHTMNRYDMAHVDGKLYFPSTDSNLLEIYLLPLPSRAIRSNTETRRWKHTTDTGAGPSAPVAHGVIAAYVQVAIDLDITVAFQGIANHITGDYWTIIQGSMYGLSIKDGSGVEYVKASNGVLYAKDSGNITPDNGLIPTVGAGIIESGSNTNGSWIKYGDGTMEQWGVHTPATNNNAGTTYDYPSNEFASVKALLGMVNEVISAGLFASYVCETACLSTLQYKLKVLAHAPTTIIDAMAAISWHAIGRWKA
jgi:hypothetical protein